MIIPQFRHLLPVLACASLLVTLPARDKAPDDLYTSYTGFAIPAEPVLPAHEIHPSLWFKAADLPALKAALTADDFARRRWTALQKLADLDAPVPAAPAATGKDDKNVAIHKYYAVMSIAARAHGLMALLADDAAARAAHRQRAEELLRRAYDGPIFELDSNVKSSAVDEIYRGSWLQNYAHAYDCIQPTLTPAADQAIRSRLAREAQCVYENLYNWTETSPHNHLSKPAWGLGSIALTLSDDPRATAWLGRAIEAANKNTRYFFSGDGIYREGGHYLIFSLTNFVPFLYHYRNVSGVDGFTAFQPVFENMVQIRNSRGWLPNIEDSYIRPTPTHLVASAYRGKPTKLHSTAPLAEILAWSYATGSLGAFDQERGETGFNYTGASWDYPLEIDELLTHDATLRATPPDAAPNVFLTGGQTVLRNSWTATGAGQRHLLFHGVAVADNHNHDDQLSFILQAEGQMMCSDSGYSRGTYAGAERTAWYNTAAAHNTLTFGGQAADKNPTNATPPVSFRIGNAGLVGEEKSAYFGKKAVWRRAIFCLAGDYYAVIDRVDSKQPGEVKAWLHGGRGSLATDGARRTWTYAADRYGSAAQLHAWIAAPGAATVEKTGELTYIKGDYAVFPHLETSAAIFSAPWITLLKPAATGVTAPFKVEEQSTSGCTAVVVTTAGGKTLVLAALNSAPRQIGDISTNASLAIVRRDPTGKVIGHFAHGGTYLQVGEQNLPLK
jgi:hypothetical protein